jgi:cytochrome P450
MTAPAAPQIDLWSSSSFVGGHPREQYRWLRQNDPVHWHEEPDGRGFWAVTKHEDIRTISRDSQTFSNSPTIMMPDVGPGGGGAGGNMMIMMDPPGHTRYRNLVKSGFTPRAVEPRHERIQQLAKQIVDEVIGRGECDFVTDVAGKLPSYVIADLLGIPLEDGVMFYDWTEIIHSAPDAVSPQVRGETLQKMVMYAMEVAQRKQANPGDDLSTHLLTSEVDGDRLTVPDFISFFILLMDAGGDTTRNLVGGGMHLLLEHPDQHANLVANLDAMLPNAVEEMLRYVTPVIYMRRTLKADVEMRGKTMREGDKLLMYYGAANADEAVFPDGDRFDITRDASEHVAFGSGGAHFCLGASIARIEIAAMFREVLTRMTDIERTGETTWLASNFISGPTHLPIRFRPL